jgi:hypothetical protein
VKNYRGVNCSYGNDRTLVVKEGRAGHFVPPTSSLPEWFHPGYYDSADKVYLKLRRPPSASAKVPFKSSGRYPSEEDDIEKTRKRILKSRSNFIPTASLAGSYAPTDSSSLQQMSTSQFQDSLTSGTGTAAGGGGGGRAGGGRTSPEYFYYSVYSRSSSPQQHQHRYHRPHQDHDQDLEQQQQHSSRSSSPRYASPSKCSRPHSQLTQTGLFNPSNPWTSSSSSSTINSPVYHGSSSSPRTIHLSSTSCASLPSSRHHHHRHEGYISANEVSSQYFDQHLQLPLQQQQHDQQPQPQQPLSSYRSSLSSLHSNTNATTSMSSSATRSTAAADVSLSVSSVDSLLIKAATRQRNRYKVPDYTLGALDQQTRSKLIIPPMEFPELEAEINYLANPTSPAKATGTGTVSGTGTGDAPVSQQQQHTSLTLTPLPPPSSATLNRINKHLKEKEKEKQQLEKLYAVTTAASVIENPPLATAATATATLSSSTSFSITNTALAIASASATTDLGQSALPMATGGAGGGAGGDGEVTGAGLLKGNGNKKERSMRVMGMPQRNKANQMLDSIKSSHSVTRSSVVLNEEIPFEQSMTSYINQWTQERSFVETDLMRPRQCICRYSVDQEKTKKTKSKSKGKKKGKRSQGRRAQREEGEEQGGWEEGEEGWEEGWEDEEEEDDDDEGSSSLGSLGMIGDDVLGLGFRFDNEEEEEEGSGSQRTGRGGEGSRNEEDGGMSDGDFTELTAEDSSVFSA